MSAIGCMKPMLPGDAEKWQGEAKYTAGQDSCSGCHPSRTRDQLQANIDTWQSNAKAEADAAITAAQTRAEYSATVTTKPGSVLVGRATWNHKAYENDASGSVHNPTYVMAGLKKAEQMAKSVGGKFKHAAAKTPVKKKSNAHVAGRIVNGDNSAAAAAKVVLMRGSKLLGTTLSDATGNFAFTFKVTRTYKNYKVKWVIAPSRTQSQRPRARSRHVGRVRSRPHDLLEGPQREAEHRRRHHVRRAAAGVIRPRPRRPGGLSAPPGRFVCPRRDGSIPGSRPSA